MPLEIRGAHFLIRSAQLVRGTRLEQALRQITYKQNFSFQTGLSVLSLTDVVLMNRAGIRSTAVLIAPSLLVASDSLADDTIPSMQ